MATLIKHRNQYLCRIRTWNGIKQDSIYIPLRTNQKNVAIVRKTKVTQSEKHIKTGIILKHQFVNYFPWLNKKGKSELSLLTLKDAIEQFIDSHKVNISIGSEKRIKISLDRAMDVWKGNSPISHINNEHIEKFKEYYCNIHSIAGINLNLRNIKTFLRWCNDKEYIKNLPKILMLREPKQLPKYITEIQFMKLLELESLNDFMKGAFSLLISTGIRRSEMVMGSVEGRMLIVPAHLSKSREERQISLNKSQVSIIKQIHKQRDKHLDKGCQLVTFKDKFTKEFKDACIKIGINDDRINLHCLRHTYAVIQWVVSNDIYEVKTLLGHSSVKTTERYAKFNKDRLAQDFPSAYKVRLEVEKIRNNAISLPLISLPLNKLSNSSSINNNTMMDC